MIMKYRILFVLLLLLIISLKCFNQTISSGKSSIIVKPNKNERIVDSIPPVISIISPGLNEKEIYFAEENEINIIGNVTDESGIKTLFVNSEPVTLGEGDMFASKINLEEGENKFYLIAIDKLIGVL